MSDEALLGIFGIGLLLGPALGGLVGWRLGLEAGAGVGAILIGGALVDECVRRARATGASVLGLHTSRSMRAAMRLYERMGFVRDPEHDFQPPGAELVEGYLLRLNDPASEPEP